MFISNSHVEHGAGDASGMTFGWQSGCLPGLGWRFLRSAPVQGVSRPPHAAAGLSDGSPLALSLPFQSRVRLVAEYGGNKAILQLHCTPREQRAVTGWRRGWGWGGGGRFGERSMGPPQHATSARLSHHTSRHNQHASPIGQLSPMLHWLRCATVAYERNHPTRPR